MKVPSSTPLPAFLMETGIFNIEQLVHQKKLGFYNRINNMKENRLIKQVFHEQKEYCSYNNSSRVSSLESISQFYGIKLENSNNISKSRWKKAVKSAIKEKSKQIILDPADYRSKLQPLLEFRDGTNIENYMLRLPHKHAKIIFLIRTHMLNLKCNQNLKKISNV